MRTQLIVISRMVLCGFLSDGRLDDTISIGAADACGVASIVQIINFRLVTGSRYLLIDGRFRINRRNGLKFVQYVAVQPVRRTSFTRGLQSPELFMFLDAERKPIMLHAVLLSTVVFIWATH